MMRFTAGVLESPLGHVTWTMEPDASGAWVRHVDHETQLAEAQATITALSQEKEYFEQALHREEKDKLDVAICAHAAEKELKLALTLARARITQLSLENEQLKAAQSAREDTNKEGPRSASGR